VPNAGVRGLMLSQGRRRRVVVKRRGSLGPESATVTFDPNSGTSTLTKRVATKEANAPPPDQSHKLLSDRSDGQALSGRMGRREACIVNAAIIASSWPHRGRGGKNVQQAGGCGYRSAGMGGRDPGVNRAMPW
jgi:hypothetical protein